MSIIYLKILKSLSFSGSSKSTAKSLTQKSLTKKTGHMPSSNFKIWLTLKKPLKGTTRLISLNQTTLEEKILTLEISRPRQRRDDDRKCFECGRTGHLSRYCRYSRKRRSDSSRSRSRSSSSSSHSKRKKSKNFNDRT